MCVSRSFIFCIFTLAQKAELLTTFRPLPFKPHTLTLQPPPHTTASTSHYSLTSTHESLSAEIHLYQAFETNISYNETDIIFHIYTPYFPPEEGGAAVHMTFTCIHLADAFIQSDFQERALLSAKVTDHNTPETL